MIRLKSQNPCLGSGSVQPSMALKIALFLAKDPWPTCCVNV